MTGWPPASGTWTRHVCRAAAAAILALAVAGCGPGNVPAERREAMGHASGSDRSSETAGPAGHGATVVAVTDGDTIDVRIDGRVETVRLIGINTPERGECFAQEAAAALTAIVAGRRVRLEADTSDRDRYGRLLRYVWVEGRMANELMVRRGYALARRYPPDVAYADRLDAAQQRARREPVGLWAPQGCVADDADSTSLRLRIEPDPPGNDMDDLRGEWVEITNAGTEDVDLSGWTLKDESASHRFAFPEGARLPAGGALRVHTGCGSDTDTALYWCMRDSAVWNNSGDTAFLLDRSGRIVVSRSY